MDNNIKILYLMNVDWSWIRQRPHILAQQLDGLCDLTVLYPKYITRPWRRQTKTKKTKKCHGIFQIPFAARIPYGERIEKWITKKALGSLEQYDILWLSTPLYADYIPKAFRGAIVYDDMDDIVSIQTDPRLGRRLAICQAYLYKRADQIFVSSDYLLRHLPPDVQDKATLVRNGAFIHQLNPVRHACRKDVYSLGYIGTISEWFDFPLLQECLEKFHDVQIDLYGPEMVPVPQTANLFSHGIIEHKDLAHATKNVDCFIMPFLLNKVTLAVDPVKLYEYISLGQCIISVKYPEVERFAPFVYFYETKEQFFSLLTKLSQNGFPPKYNSTMQADFLNQNCWEQRIRDIDNTLTNLLS